MQTYTNNIERQRAQILRQQQATPKLAQLANKGDEVTESDSLIRESAFRAESVWDYGTADDFNQNLMMQYRAPSGVMNYDLTTGNLFQQENSGHQNLSPREGDQSSILNTSRLNTTTIFTKDEKEIREDPKWIPNEQAPSCTNCKKDFKFYFRHHHCRICYKVFCKNCSTTTMMKVEGTNKEEKRRACLPCIKLLEEFNTTKYNTQQLLND